MIAMHQLGTLLLLFDGVFFFGRGQVSIQKGKKKEPFRAAFSKVKDLRSFLPGVPILALTASVKLKDRASLWKACGMVTPLVVDLSPNKDNIYFGFELIEVEAEALNRLKWVATMVERERQETPQTIIFCKTFNDIANIISYLLMNLRGSVFVEQEGDKVPLIGVYHAKSWDTQKSRTEKDFKENGTQRVVVATCALGMGVNFPNVQYVIHYGPPQTVTEIIQQAGRAGRTDQQAYSFVYTTKRQLSLCDKEVKDLVKSENCMRETLYGHFQESVSSKEPGHDCCSLCRKKCQCSIDGSCDANMLVDSLTPDNVSELESGTYTPRDLNELDKNDLRLSLLELKERYSSGLVSLFHEETCHGFSDKLINDIVEHANHVFSGKYLTNNLAMYSSIHAIDVLEVFQEIFGDITQFDQEMDELHLKKQFTDKESYLLSSSVSVDSSYGETEELLVPDYELEF